jgi:hypothetical protein
VAVLFILVPVVFVRIVFRFRACQGGFDRAAFFSMIVTKFRSALDVIWTTRTLALKAWWRPYVTVSPITVSPITASLGPRLASRAPSQ